MESILIVKESSEAYFYTIFKLRNVKNDWNELISVNGHRGLKESRVISMESQDILIKNLYPKAKSIDFQYQSSTSPFSSGKLSDSIFIQRFENAQIKVSLTEKKQGDLYIKKRNPFEMILYRQRNNLYLILAELTFKGKENKWIAQEELEKTLYPLVKNWGVYEK